MSISSLRIGITMRLGPVFLDIATMLESRDPVDRLIAVAKRHTAHARAAEARGISEPNYGANNRIAVAVEDLRARTCA